VATVSVAVGKVPMGVTARNFQTMSAI
jgi:hypothetical protein